MHLYSHPLRAVRSRSYSEAEKVMLASFESLEYLPPNNQIYRDYLSDKSVQHPSATTRWLAMAAIGSSVGFVGFLLKSTIERIGEWRRSLLFDTECRGNKIDIWVNGEHVNNGFDCTTDHGQIAIQAEGAPCEFRKLELQPLSAH